jgi:hypothetical protein
LEQSCNNRYASTEVNYSTFDRELLAAMSGIKHFRSRLEGRPFQVWTCGGDGGCNKSGK